MAGAYRHMSKAQAVEDFADAALVQADSEAILDQIAQIDTPPTHDAVLIGIWSLLHNRRKLDQLFRRQPLLRAGLLARDEPGNPFAVVAMNPVAQRLPIHPARQRRLGARSAIKNQCKC